MKMFKTGKNGYIRSVCSPGKDEAWLLHDGSNYISLVNSKGEEKKCYDLGVAPHDAVILKSGDILFSTVDNSLIKKLEKDGTVSEFADLTPFRTRGLCLKSGDEVFVCLSHPSTKGENKIVQLSKTGTILQEIQKDKDGHQLFYDPCRVVYTNNDVLVVTDWLEDRNVVVSFSIKDFSIRHIWKGHIDGTETERFRPVGITQNEHYVLMADLFNAQVYGMDATNKVEVLAKGVSSAPLGMCVDVNGKLWLGCDKGTVNIVQI